MSERGYAAASAVDTTRDSAAPGIDAGAATTAGSVVRGGLWGTAGGIIPQLYTLAMSVVAARILGPEEFGRQSFIAFVELSVIMLVTGGLPLALMRYFGERIGAGDRSAVRSLFVWAWAIEIAAGLAGGGVLVAAGVAGAEPENAWLLAGVAATMGALHAVPSALLLGAQRWRAATVVGLTTGAFGTAAVITVLAAGGGITGVFAVEAVVSIANLIWTSWLARRALAEIAPGPLTGGRVSHRAVWQYAAVSTIGAVLIFVVWRRSELFFLERFSTETEIGLYSIAFAAVSAIMRIPEVIATVAISATATLLGAGAVERIRGGWGRAARLLLLLTLPLTAGALALGPEALRLAYGDEYEDTGAILVILLLPFPLIPLMNLATAVLIGLGRLWTPIVMTGVGAAVNIAFALTLIPPYDAVGAAIANSIAQGVGALLAIFYAARAIEGANLVPSTALGGLLGAGGGGLAAWFAVLLLPGWWGVALGIIAGIAVFGTLGSIVKVLPADDALWLDENAGRRFGGLIGRASRLWAAESA